MNVNLFLAFHKFKLILFSPPLPMLRICIAALAIFAAYQMMFSVSEVNHGPGVIAPNLPTQQELRGEAGFTHNGFNIQPLARFNIEARVLSRKNYSFDEESKLAPIDLALGWGSMSDERVLDTMEIKQSNRWYHWRTDKFVIPRKEVIESSANMHLVPANDQVSESLDEIVKGNVVRISGYLIEAESSDMKWRSSLTRTDRGANACELIYVQSIEIL